MKYRYESFGGIIASDEPPFLAFVDRQYMRELELDASPLWEGSEEVGVLTAPLEVHFAITNACDGGCAHCYMDSGERDSKELDTAEFKKALDLLKSLDVFHIALGGGEALLRADLFEVACYARDIGLVPNLTTNGLHITKEIAKKMTCFGQVNLSLDGVGETSGVFRGTENFETVDRAAGHLLGAGISAGINCVLGRRNFDSLPDLFAYAKKKGLTEIELLRFKPVGRAADRFADERTTHAQNRALVPLLTELAKKYETTAKIDCSFVPMLCYGRPDAELLEKTATYGCEAGNVLLGIRANGTVAGCSFMGDSGLTVWDLKNPGPRLETFQPYFDYIKSAPEPCKSCDYLTICKGGCRAVSAHVTGDPMAPDPDCPFVVEYEAKQR